MKIKALTSFGGRNEKQLSQNKEIELSTTNSFKEKLTSAYVRSVLFFSQKIKGFWNLSNRFIEPQNLRDERGDVPGWVLVVLMTTGLVTAIWTIAAPRLSTILRNSLDSMNGIR